MACHFILTNLQPNIYLRFNSSLRLYSNAQELGGGRQYVE